MAPRNEPLAAIKSRRNNALNALVSGVPYIRWLGIVFDRRGDELTAVLPFDEKLIGNPLLPAIHGGVTAAFLEVSLNRFTGTSVAYSAVFFFVGLSQIPQITLSRTCLIGRFIGVRAGQTSHLKWKPCRRGQWISENVDPFAHNLI